LKKKLLFSFLALALIIVTLLSACTPSAPSTTTTPEKPALPPKDKIIIGQAVSLSGPLASGNAVASTPYYDLWVHDVNADGGIYVKEYGKKLPVELKIYDDTSDIGTMTQLLGKLITEDKVDFILPPWSTAMLFAAAPIANKHQYILIGGAGGAAKLKEVIQSLPYFFSVLNFSDTQMPVLADVLVELNAKKAAIVFLEDLHGIEFSGAAVPEFASKGIDITMVKSIPADVKDASLLLKQAKSDGADAFIGMVYPDQAILLTAQAMELNYNPKVFSLSVGPAFDFYTFIFGPNIEGVMGGGAWNAKSTPKAQWFIDHYKEVTGNDVGNWWGALYFYASMEHFKQCVEEAGTLDQSKIRDIMETAHFPTVCGDYWYENHFFVNHPGEWGQWQKGIFEVIDPGVHRTAAPELKPVWQPMPQQ
jgi:branched-chain amino acid transport system substrate-binding protein